MNTVNERIEALRGLMEERGIDAYIIDAQNRLYLLDGDRQIHRVPLVNQKVLDIPSPNWKASTVT